MQNSTARNAQTDCGADDEPLGIEAFQSFDRMREALLAQVTGGLSPAAVTLAMTDWALHLAAAPGKQAELAYKGWRKAARLQAHMMRAALDPATPACIAPLPGDHRFSHPGWAVPPFSFWAQGFLLTQQWWHNVTHEVPGVEPHHEDVVSFAARQMLDMMSPSNLPFANPEVMAKARETGGMNFVHGWQNWLEDATCQASGQPAPEAQAFRPGHEVAVTPGRVVFRNHLIELIQYAPETETVHPEPVLIVPAWIMKYYILDLSPENSMIRYLVGKGHTVFCISWRNPGPEDRDLTLDDYRRQGVMAALEAIGAVVPGRKVHAAGYCLGGTLLAIAAAAMASRGDDRLASITLLAAQTDFTEPGELALFIDDSQLHFLESMMWNRGYLSADQMAGAFQMLRSNDLVWSRIVHDYMMGARAPMTDLMAWNADTTRMPYRMHAEYLRRLYLDNELAGGRFFVEGHSAALPNIRAPMFVVGTERDHVAPWHSVYKIHALSDADITFVLTSGGHNAGIVSEPGHAGRHYRIGHKASADALHSAEGWFESHAPQPGSWWQPWSDWLAARSTGPQIAPPPLGTAASPTDPAPGTYVLQG